VEENALVGLIETRFSQLAGLIEGLRGEVGHLRGETRHAIDELRGENRNLREETRDLRLEAGTYFDHLRDEIQLVGEGVSIVNEKLDRHALENVREFKEVRDLVHLFSAALTDRIAGVEQRVTVLETRR
jgi:hypothetical protein